jgi:CubicO group peptidase (beta-lactamase class C family)
VVAILVERGLLDYDSKIGKYWPEFAHNGKGDISLADVLRHESGLAWINHTFKRDDLLVENIKANKVGRVLEQESPHFPQVGGTQNTPTKREYHSITRGCILNEVVRRVDPKVMFF